MNLPPGRAPRITAKQDTCVRTLDLAATQQVGRQSSEVACVAPSTAAMDIYAKVKVWDLSTLCVLLHTLRTQRTG